jgi:hypothetical protein
MEHDEVASTSARARWCQPWLRQCWQMSPDAMCSLQRVGLERFCPPGGETAPCASVHDCTLSRVSEEAARAASSALAMVDTAERLLDRDLEASDYAGVAASRE